MPTLHRHLPGLALRRLCAACSAALVLALAVFAVSPSAHAWVHDDEGHADQTAQHDDHCAVVLFAGGVSLPLDHDFISVPDAGILPGPLPAPDELLLALPRYLRLPERGPPVNRVV